jgi:hypothetical protein
MTPPSEPGWTALSTPYVSLGGVIAQRIDLDDELAVLELFGLRDRSLLDLEGVLGDPVGGSLVEDPDFLGLGKGHDGYLRGWGWVETEQAKCKSVEMI